MLGTFPHSFYQATILPNGNFPSGNFPNEQFPKRILPKSALAAALGLIAAMWRLRKPNQTLGKLLLGKLKLGKMP